MMSHVRKWALGPAYPARLPQKSDQLSGLLQTGKSGKILAFLEIFWKVRESQGMSGNFFRNNKKSGKSQGKQLL